ncbi:unnamed protein product, partial [Mesorhabditis belari]|uniref:Transmembrane protein 151B n=1 Tax=Mesorhabditis belari TaxID=2138241 RepID=A0AAF3F4A2_9BILA
MFQKVRRRSLLRVIVRSPYWKCFICTLLIGLCIFYATWCHFHHNAYSANSVFNRLYQHGACAQGYNFIPIVFGVMLYVVYLMECWHSRTRHTKIKRVNLDTAEAYLNQLRDSLPIVWWRAVCYHYLRRTRQVTRYRNGDAITATQVYYERVNSHSAGNVFIYDICGLKDISKMVLCLEDFPVTRVKIARGFVFACMQAANEFEEQRTRFFNENELKDDYMEVREGMDMANLEFDDELLCFKTQNPPWFLRPTIFWVTSLFLLSWPLRIFAEWRTAFLSFHVTKLFGTNYLSPSSINYTGPLTRTSTMDTADLEALLRREQYFVVPSYSQAMLMNPANANVVLMAPSRTPNAFFNRHGRPSINNENIVFRNYGALEEDDLVDDLRTPPRSRSFSFFRGSTRGPQRAAPIRLPSARRVARSVSIGGISLTGAPRGSDSYAWPIDSSRDRTPLLPNEPPPPYEVALRMCAPLYERLRRSFSARLNSLSGSTKELKNNNNSSGNP